MTAHEFKISWTNTEEPLSPIASSHLDRFDLQKSTISFLAVAGLPICCEPNLYFANDSGDIVYGINKLTEQFDFEDQKEEYDKYIVVGSCRDGDAIAIDTTQNDKIVQLDHEDLFSPSYFNSSINTLADFLILYRDFEEEILADKDRTDDFQVFNFTNLQFDRLLRKMEAIDKEAMIENGFWKSELKIMLSLRRKYFNL